MRTLYIIGQLGVCFFALAAPLRAQATAGRRAFTSPADLAEAAAMFRSNCTVIA